MWDFFKWNAPGSEPLRLMRQDIGVLPVPSGSVLIADSQYLDEPIRVDNVTLGQLAVSLDLLHSADGGCRVAKLNLTCGRSATIAEDAPEQLAIDSAKVVVVDESFYQRFWTQTGPDRLGVVVTPSDTRVPQLLKQHFNLDCRLVN